MMDNKISLIFQKGMMINEVKSGHTIYTVDLSK